MPTPFSMDPAHYTVISSMITPAFFLTATSSMLMSSNARLARVVDRMRVDLAKLRETPQGEQRRQMEARIVTHRKRSTLALSALRLLYGSLSAFVCTSLAIAADSFLGYRLAHLPTFFAIIGVLLMFGASVCMGREARLGLKMLDLELREELSRDTLEAIDGGDRRPD
ncbi:DUF2721 domain-containing protein [Coralloluteibacterium thermophilus]|uniref:DUF2721 domain-containing protein n=1 Tax=Coralloluteibacterium thermophilum TaxID=2707049 RepID=A0ABV9NLL2_9GAMM